MNNTNFKLNLNRRLLWLDFYTVVQLAFLYLFIYTYKLRRLFIRKEHFDYANSVRVGGE